MPRLLGTGAAICILTFTAGCGILPGGKRRPQVCPTHAEPDTHTTPDPNLPAGVPTDLGNPIATLPYDDEHGTKLTLDVYPMRSRGEDVVQLWAKLSRESEPPDGTNDNLGSHEHGIDLSNRRAQAVQSALEPGLPGYQFTAEGLAEADPVAPNDFGGEPGQEPAGRNLLPGAGRGEAHARADTPAPTTAPAPQPANEVAGAAAASDRNGGRYELGVHPVVVEDGLASMRVTVRVKNDPNPQEPQLDFLSADDSDGADRVMGTPRARQRQGGREDRLGRDGQGSPRGSPVTWQAPP